MCLQVPKILILNRKRFNNAYKVVALLQPLLQRSSISSHAYITNVLNTFRLTIPYLNSFEKVKQNQKRCIVTLQKILNVEHWREAHVLHTAAGHMRHYIQVAIDVVESNGYNKRSRYALHDMDASLYMLKLLLNKKRFMWPFTFMNPCGYKNRSYSSSSDDESVSTSSSSSDEEIVMHSDAKQGNTQILVDSE